MAFSISHQCHAGKLKQIKRYICEFTAKFFMIFDFVVPLKMFQYFSGFQPK